MNQEFTWRKRYRILFERFTNPYDGTPINLEFKADLERLRELGDRLEEYKNIYTYGTTQPLTVFMKKYSLPLPMYDFLREYVLTERLDYSLIKPGLFIVYEQGGVALSDVDNAEEKGWADYKSTKAKIELFEGQNAELKLVISPDAKNREIVEFIRKNKVFIEKKQKLLKTKYETLGRIRSRPKQDRDYEILRLYDEGYTAKEIADEVNKNEALSGEPAISYRDVGRILRDLKRRDKEA